MTDKPNRPAYPAGPASASPPAPPEHCPVPWCEVRHADLAQAVWVAHQADLATSSGAGEHLTVRLTWCQGRDGAPSDNPRVLLVVNQQASNAEPLPPGLLQLDRRQATDLARALTSASGPHWLAETLYRAVRVLGEQARPTGRTGDPDRPAE